VLLKRELIAESDLHLFKVTNSVDDAIAEIVNFYRVYHSMRYVKGDLVIRLNRVISPTTLEKIQAVFGDIVKSGTFEQTNALPEESEEPLLARLPRLKFRFDRHKLGRLRQLIDVVNQD
jgi:hypothetical protein